MTAVDCSKEYYQALLDKNTEYEGIFFVGVKTTGVFCRPSCPARKPKFENCEFFHNAQEALLASYRPCKKCQPLSHPNSTPKLIQTLIQAVEENPEKRWKDQDFRELGVDVSTVRRQFKKRFGMTFVEYARARRMGIAMKEIRKGNSVIEAQLTAGYESGSGFRDAFSQIMGQVPSKSKHQVILKASWLDTELGPMLAVADDKALYLLEFVDRRGLEREIERLRQRAKAAIIPGETKMTQMIADELKEYFAGNLSVFKTPLHFIGSDFQQQVWHALIDIPYADTRSYSQQAQHIKQPKAVRAVARANGANQIAIVVPCHRVIGQDGSLTGYGGGLARKKWLLDHENKHKNTTV